jgi:ribosome-binding ATPase
MLRTGLIGFPSTGKTTIFRLMTSAHELERGGHGRQEVSIGIARVPDDRLDLLTALYKPRKRVPATVEFADLAAPSRGGGAQALLDVAPYRNAEALVHVVRAFRDPSIPHPSGSVDPARDARAMEDELILADLAVAEKRLERIVRELKKGRSAEMERERELLDRCREALEGGFPLRACPFPEEDRKRLRGFQFFSAKPLLLVVNLDESDIDAGAAGPLLADADAAAARFGITADPSAGTRATAVCAKIELEIAQLAPADASAFLSDLGLREPGVDRIIRASYELLGYISFFTVGDDECRAWSVPRGTPAQLAAGEIHTDMSRGFIRAEVVRHDDLIARGSMHVCREHGEVRLEGKDYVVQDGDVINVRFAI